MTTEQIKRTKLALNETHEAIAKAKSYQEKFWDLKLIGQLEQHVAKLNGMLLQAA